MRINDGQARGVPVSIDTECLSSLAKRRRRWPKATNQRTAAAPAADETTGPLANQKQAAMK